MLEYATTKIVSITKLQEAVERKYGQQFSHPFISLITNEPSDEDSVRYFYFGEEDDDAFYSEEENLIRQFLREEFPSDKSILIDLYY